MKKLESLVAIRKAKKSRLECMRRQLGPLVFVDVDIGITAKNVKARNLGLVATVEFVGGGSM
jgi:hypothetical protein